MSKPTQPFPADHSTSKDDTRTRILDAVLALMASGDDLNHDSVAKHAGLGRRTVYRYFEDREALLGAAWTRITELAGPKVGFPKSEAELVDTLQPIHRGFDEIAELQTVLRSTPKGRAIRLAQRPRRVAAYRAATKAAVRKLPQPDQVLATAMLQVLHTTPWLEMRDQWELDGTQIAEACEWAIRVLLADLQARGGLPLSEGPAKR